jgi:signal transduction histidine kinase
MRQNAKKKTKKSLFRHKYSWFKFTLPVLISLAIVILIIHVIYLGGPRESIASGIESEIMRLSLSKRVPPITAQSKSVVTFSVSDADLKVITTAPNRLLRDAHISEYASVLEYVIRSNPRWVVLSWLSHAHPLTPEYLKPLTDLIERSGARDKVTLAINFFAGGRLDPSYIQRFNIVEAIDCYHLINLHCTVSPKWSWMPQQVFSRFIDNALGVTSTDLQHHLPNIILNVPDLNKLTKYSFMDAREPVAGILPQEALVFIGNAATQPIMFRNNKEVLQRTFTAQSDASQTLQQNGIPWHVFWAGLTAMLLQSNTLQVATKPVVYSVIIALGLGFLLLALRRIDKFSFIVPIGVIAFVLFGNLYLIPAGLYLPVAPILVTCIIALPIAFILIEMRTHYKQTKLRASAKKAEKISNLKQNFLQLMSHNLNTPIAQLKGLLELLVTDGQKNATLKMSLRLTDFMRVTTKIALATSVTSKTNLNTQRITLRESLERFLDDEAGFFNRIGVDLQTLNYSDEVTKNNFDRILHFDPEIISNCLLTGIILHVASQPTNEILITTMITPGESGEERGSLHILLQSQNSGVEKTNHDIPEFLRHTMSRYIEGITASGRASLNLGMKETLLIFKDIVR